MIGNFRLRVVKWEIMEVRRSSRPEGVVIRGVIVDDDPVEISIGDHIISHFDKIFLLP